MKKYISNLIFLVILFGIMIISPNVNAASASVSASSSTVYVGDNAYFTVSIYGAAWNVTVSGNSSDRIAGYNEDGVNQSVSKSYSINTSSPGTYTLSISGDVTEQDSDDSTPIGGSASITVVARPAQNNNTNNNSNNNTNNNSNSNNTTSNNNNSNNANTNDFNNNTNEDTKKETKEDETKQVKELTPLNITKFEIVGYDINFKDSVTEYDLDISSDLKKLYIIVEGKDITIEGNGIIDITNKDSISVKIKNSDQEKTYKINLKKQELGISKTTGEDTKNKGNIFMATTAIFGLSTVILAFFLVRDLLKFKKQNKIESL